jgi:hypothetical protein
MRKSPKRPVAAVLHRFALCLAAALLAAPSRAPAALLDLRPGPIERPMHVAVADFDRDGYDDLIVANFEAGTLHLLINQRDGTFAPHPDSPFLVGVATFSQATSGPLRVVVAELTPDDADGDGVLNSDDNCPNVPNSNQDDLVPGVCGRGTCDPRGVGLCTTGAVGDPCTIDTDCDTPDLCTAGAIGDPCTLDTDCDVGGAAGVQCRVGEDTDGDGVIDTPIDTDMDGVPDFDLVDTLGSPTRCRRMSSRPAAVFARACVTPEARVCAPPGPSARPARRTAIATHAPPAASGIPVAPRTATATGTASETPAPRAPT